MPNQRLQYLLEKARDENASPAELDELLLLIRSDRSGEVYEQLNAFHSEALSKGPLKGYDTRLWQTAFNEILSADHAEEESQGEETPARPLFKLHHWFRYAAVIILVIATSVYFWMRNNQKQSLVADNKHLQQDILAGSDGAILTLADGSQVVLDSLGDGLVAAQNGAQVMLKNGQIAYTATGNAIAHMEYNTMSTPKGRQFQITLPDGTKVWLNAASSIRYPTVFTGKERRVYVTGETYFEVAQNATMPFRVSVNNMTEVAVLGTSFNINAYENEKLLNTTLLEGSVKVNGKIIKVGQQAQVPAIGVAADHAANRVRVVNIEDMSKVMAWKNGYFNFEGVGLEEAMRQLSRWYDIEIVYEKGIPAIRFFGKMSRALSLTGVLKGLEEMGVRCRMEEGRRLVVMQ